MSKENEKSEENIKIPAKFVPPKDGRRTTIFKVPRVYSFSSSAEEGDSLSEEKKSPRKP